MLTGENGILTQAQRAKDETEKAKANEQKTLTGYEQIINSSTGVTLKTITGYETNNTVTQDSLGNRVIVPAGFKVVNPEDNVEDGIVIEDVSHGDTAGSQFVWIPVGTGIQKKDGTVFDINLSRYTFDKTTGEATDQGNKVLNVDWQELASSNYGNTVAKDIRTFISKVNKAGGYYIGRYEARTTAHRTVGTDDSGLTQITVKPDDYVYNWVTQPQAANISRNMYTDGNFESDLMNSYSWDTAIVFLQECDNRDNKTKPYSRQNSLNTESLAERGTNKLETKDKICNIFDMASNCLEWTTETSSEFASPVIRRGGDYDRSDYCTGDRGDTKVLPAYAVHSFRPILYL